MSDKVGTTKFGPCIDGNHGNCQSEFVWSGVVKVCSCDCHRKKGKR